jgi:hypothetical protein
MWDTCLTKKLIERTYMPANNQGGRGGGGRGLASASLATRRRVSQAGGEARARQRQDEEFGSNVSER